MSTKPILFSTPMVQALLEDRKWQTRRVIKFPSYIKEDMDEGHFRLLEEDGSYSYGWSIQELVSYGYLKRPYRRGDILWVRETWALQECEKCQVGIPSLGGECKCDYVYRANYGKTEDDTFPPSMFRWRPSIYMPREAARLFLRVKDVRVEGVQDITHAGVLAEGIPQCPGWKYELSECDCTVWSFAELWDSLNAKRGYGWDKNPWVWVYSFERVDKPAGWPGGEGGE